VIFQKRFIKSHLELVTDKTKLCRSSTAATLAWRLSLS
jgi:hypothetical protein